MSNQICLKCHFLIKLIEGTDYIPSSLNERERKYVVDFDYKPLVVQHRSQGFETKLMCHHGVWDFGLSWSQYEEQVNLDRKDTCFFWLYKTGVTLSAAEIFQKRQEEGHKFRNSLKWTQFGLLVAGAGLIVNAVLSYMQIKSPIAIDPKQYEALLQKVNDKKLEQRILKIEAKQEKLILNVEQLNNQKVNKVQEAKVSNPRGK